MERNCRSLGLKLQEARKKIEDKEMMTEGLGAITSEKTKDTEALKKNYTGDLENKSRLSSQLGVASCGDGSTAGRILHFQMDDEDVSDKQFWFPFSRQRCKLHLQE